MKINQVLIITVSIVAFPKVAALKCFTCSYNVTLEGVQGDPSCAIGNTPEDRFVEECPPPLAGLYPVCLRMILNQTTPKQVLSTVRRCSELVLGTLDCKTYPDEKDSTWCVCNTDKCDPEDYDPPTTTTTQEPSAASKTLNLYDVSVLFVFVTLLLSS